MVIKENVSSMKIAVIDDDPASIDLMRKKLVSHGYERLVFANTGKEGLALVRENLPDIVVLDIVMPDMNGFELCSSLRQDRKFHDLPVIMITGGAIDSDEAIEEAFRSGATDFITKPIRTSEFLARIKAALELKAAGDRLKREVEKRRTAEKEMENVRDCFRNIINSMPSILVGVDDSGKVSYWNSEAERVSGTSAVNMEGVQLEDAFPQLSEEIREARQAIADGTPQKYEKEFIQKNGEVKSVDIMVYPLLEKACKASAVIRIDDVTEKIQAEEKMAQVEKIAFLGWFAVGMAHEISNPLAGILQNVQLIRKRIFSGMLKNRQVAEAAGTTIENIRDYLEKRGLTERFDSIKDLGQRASKLVDNMLSLSRSGCFSFDKHNLENILESAVGLVLNNSELGLVYDLQQIEIKRDYENVPDVFCDSYKLEQVFFNILKNSVSAVCGKRETGFVPKITLITKEKKDWVMVEIRDNGIGMDQKVKERIFEPFFTTWELDSFTGLGLSLSYFIITENHKGRLEVESSPGRGSRLIIHLPKEVSPVGFGGEKGAGQTC